MSGTSIYDLDQGTRYQIKYRELPPSTVQEVHDNVDENVATKIRTMRIVGLVMAGFLILTLAGMLKRDYDAEIIAFTILVSGGILFGLLAVIRFVFVPRPIRQFVSSLQEGYPELVPYLGKDSFTKLKWYDIRVGKKLHPERKDWIEQLRRQGDSAAYRKERRKETGKNVAGSIAFIAVILAAAVFLTLGMDSLSSGRSGFYVRIALFPVAAVFVIIYWIRTAGRNGKSSVQSVSKGLVVMALCLAPGYSLYPDLQNLRSPSEITLSHLSTVDNGRNAHYLVGYKSGTTSEERFRLSLRMDGIYDYQTENGVEYDDIICVVTYLPKSRYVLDVRYETAGLLH